MTAGELELPTTPQPPSVGGRRSAIVSGLLLLPAGFWYLVLLVIPLLLVVAVSFGVRGPDGGYVPAFTLDNYATVLNRTDPFDPPGWRRFRLPVMSSSRATLASPSRPLTLQSSG